MGDAYLVASGVPTPNGDHHAAEIAKLSLDILGIYSAHCPLIF